MNKFLTLAIIIAVAGLAWGEEPAPPTAPAQPMIKMSPGTAKIMGDPVVKDLPAMKIAAVMVKASAFAPEGGYTKDQAGVDKAYESMMQDGFSKLMQWSHQTATWPSGPALAMYYEDPTMTEPEKLTAKVAFPVKPDAKGNENVAIEDLPAMRAICLTFQGPYNEANNAWTTVMNWSKANGYVWAGPPMEVYLKGQMDVKDPKDFLTEIRVPVQKAEAKPAEK